MKTQELSAASNLKVKMSDDALELEGVIVNSLGVEVKKGQMASSYSRVKGTAITDSGENSILKGL